MDLGILAQHRRWLLPLRSGHRRGEWADKVLDRVERLLHETQRDLLGTIERRFAEFDARLHQLQLASDGGNPARKDFKFASERDDGSNEPVTLPRFLSKTTIN